MRLTTLAAGTAAAVLAGSALGNYTITQTFDQAPTYDNLITFDEDGVPVGQALDPFTFYQSSHGVTFTSGNGLLVVDDWDAIDGIDGGEGDGNSLVGGFSISMHFDSDVTSASWQGWASGSPAPPFGGINVILLDDGNTVGSYQGIAPFGGAGDEWFDVVATDGMVFDEIRFFNPAFNSFTSYIDNLSFTTVPAPGAIALLGLAGLVGRRRRG